MPAYAGGFNATFRPDVERRVFRKEWVSPVLCAAQRREHPELVFAVAKRSGLKGRGDRVRSFSLHFHIRSSLDEWS